MKNKILTVIITLLMIPFVIRQPVCAIEGAEPLQLCFTDDGKRIEIFTSERLDDDARLLIGSDNFDADVVNSDVKINTLFLIDNSKSILSSVREQLKEEILNYVSDMNSNENVKVALFDTKLSMLSDKYTNDRGFIEYELSKVNFTGEGSAVYDAVLEACKSFKGEKGVYSRIVLITDGFGSNDSISFDYLKSEINERCRYHIDVVQISADEKSRKKLNEIVSMGSNSFNFYTGKGDLSFLRPGNVSVLRAELSESVTVGEVKGVTIKNGTSDMMLGSVTFPQVEIWADTDSNDWLLIVFVIVSSLLAAAAAVFVIFIFLKKKRRFCSVSVQIEKDDERDRNGIGMDVWRFPISGEFRVGRTIKPVSGNGKLLPKNDRAIFENATNDDISSIGRNAFSMSYDPKTNAVMIKNTASSATFYVETAGRKDGIRNGQTAFVIRGSRILLGNYTTIVIHNFAVN